jgi:hypothetical protein
MNPNTFEHDYIIAILQQYSQESEIADKSKTLDKYAGQITAFMNGRILEAVKYAKNK